MGSDLKSPWMQGVLSRNGEKAICAGAQGRESKVKLERSAARSCTACQWVYEAGLCPENRGSLGRFSEEWRGGAEQHPLVAV